MRNVEGATDGNDGAVDNIRLIDVTPQLDKSFASGPLAGGAYGVGKPARLTFTITNRDDYLVKAGWGFTDTLPQDLVVASPANLTSTCTALNASAAPGSNVITVTSGTLPAGSTNPSCTINLDVTSTQPGSYQNGPANISGARGIDLPGNATVVFAYEQGIRLQKAFIGNRLADSDQVTLSILGGAGPVTGTTTGTGSAVTSPPLSLNGVVAGLSYNLSETPTDPARAALYDAQYACTNATAGGQTPSGTGASFTITPAANDSLTCTFTNRARATDLQVLKTSSSPSAQSGGEISYTVSATNAGPSAADGAVLRDQPDVGLDCAALAAQATCTASGGAVCPGTGAALSSSLLGAGGATILTFPAGGKVDVTLRCRVTATGRP